MVLLLLYALLWTLNHYLKIGRIDDIADFRSETSEREHRAAWKKHRRAAARAAIGIGESGVGCKLGVSS